MQELPTLDLRLLPQLAELGSSMQLSGIWPLGEYHCGLTNFKETEGIAYELQLANTGGGVLLTGTITAKAETECARCLEPAQLDIAGEVEGYFLIHPSHDELDLADDEFSVIDEDGKVDLAPALYAALIIETPLVVLCNDDCQGLCPQCGANRNVQECDCSKSPDPDSPFAVLKDLEL